MGQSSRVLLVLAGLLVLVLLAGVGGTITDERTGVQPVIGTNGHSHQGKGSKGSHGGEKDLDPTLTPQHGWTREEADV